MSCHVSTGSGAIIIKSGGAGRVEVITDFASGRGGLDGRRSEGVHDPIGGDDDEYEATFQEIRALVTRVIQRLPGSTES